MLDVMPPSLIPSFRRLEQWNLDEVARAIGAEISQTSSDRSAGKSNFAPISTDTRRLKPGEFFLALEGPNFDGHRYCGVAVENGAAGLIVRDNFPSTFDARLPVLRVPDPLRAYGDLAGLQRRNWGGRVIAISGSFGKTTTRRLVARALARHQKVLEPQQNYNNLIGVPQTLLRLQADHETAVLELGMNQPGELRRLAEIARADVAGLIRIGKAHVENFGSLQDVIDAKLALFEAAAPGVPLVINVACANSAGAIERFSPSHPVITFRAEGEQSADCFIEHVTPLEPAGYKFDLITPAGRYPQLVLRRFGRHLLEDVAAGAAFLTAAGFDPGWIVDAVEDFETEPLRGEVIQAGPWTFIMDCYNAGPESMVGALNSLRELPPAKRTVLVLADMLELGEHSREAHEALLDPLRKLFPALVFGLGPEMSHLAETLSAQGWDAKASPGPQCLLDELGKALRPGDRVLFKGSRAFALEKIARTLAPEAFGPTDSRDSLDPSDAG